MNGLICGHELEYKCMFLNPIIALSSLISTMEYKLGLITLLALAFQQCLGQPFTNQTFFSNTCSKIKSSRNYSKRYCGWRLPSIILKGNSNNLQARTTVGEIGSVCGGMLSSEFGEISYKENKNYANDENCSWVIEVPGSARIGFNLLSSGFEECCDFVTIASIDSDGVLQQPTFKLTNGTVDGPRAIVTFSSDRSERGTGFRLLFHKLAESGKRDSCGGSITGSRGVINYRPEEEYTNNLRCVWVLHSPNSTSIAFNILRSNFESCCDVILVNSVDPDTGTLRNDSTKITGENSTATVEASLVVILFYSDHSRMGTGFSLSYESSGNEVNPNIQLSHESGENVTVEYSQHAHLLVLASSTDEPRDEKSTTALGLQHGAFDATDSCEYDSLAVYTPFRNGWSTEFAFPNDTCDATLPEDRILNLPHSFVVIYKPLERTGNNFALAYSQKVYACGGVLEPLESGEIVYKENQRYFDLENCTWRVQVPHAAKISFSLENSGFEECCDFVTVNAINATRALQGPSFKLTSKNRTAEVSGSTALVTFSSDRSVVGTGFRLRYRKDECGGELKPLERGFDDIVYKENDRYGNDLHCEWRILVPNATTILFNLENNGFEPTHDFINVTSPHSGVSVKLTSESTNRPFSVVGPTALVTFFSDGSVTGTGFRLRYLKTTVF
ncbi:Cubilin [Orchesella cincta]|uniref:Cubilin n=1 Tax=Orchesella cincta TaxID=48709 RepID=A0A1D2ME45_ORCCI|nr:Cubilin [Orchesella cincta]